MLSFLRISLVLLFVIASTVPLQAEGKSLLSKEESQAGFVSLFNGNDLTGWKISENGKFKVKEGMIVVSGARAHLFTEKEYKNFEFRAEVKTTPGSNSGIYFHTQYQEKGYPKLGHESQVNVTHRDTVKTGSLYRVVKLKKTKVKDNEWWTQTIIVKGKHIVIKINGEIVVDYVEPNDVKGGRKLSKGSFAIQAHDPKSVVYFRDIRVKELND